AVFVERSSRELDAISILDTSRRRFANEMMVDVGAQPMRIGDRIVGARGHEQSFRFEPSVGKSLPGMMAIEGEAAFESAYKLGAPRKPTPMRREIDAVVEAVA